jgi:O-succinylbenzoate synthase
MRYQVEFRSYQQRFQQPLHTSHGCWEIRTGIHLKLTNATGHSAWGEIAPLPCFGSETLEQAIEFCQQLGGEIGDREINSIADQLPACQFGFESARAAMATDFELDEANGETARFCGLLPTGQAALQGWRSLWQQGYRTLKWKIGVAPIATELALFDQLIHALPAAARLRLDANGGCDFAATAMWLGMCDRARKHPTIVAEVEYLEQPLPPAQFKAMQQLGDRFVTPIALDESVATLHQLKACYERGWRGICVIKPAIIGSPDRLRQFCQTHAIDAVFSSSFETQIGRQAGLKLAAELGNPQRAIGYGVTHWFADSVA